MTRCDENNDDLNKKDPQGAGGLGRDCPRVYHAIDLMRCAVERGEWERGQTHESLLAYLDEEVAEFHEAVRALSPGDESAQRHLCDELADIFLQVLFHAEIAARRGSFTIDDVAGAFVQKMRSRAPYLFDQSTGIVAVEEQERLWQLGKQREAQLACRVEGVGGAD